MKKQISKVILLFALFQMLFQLSAVATVTVKDANPKDFGIRATLVSGSPVADGSSSGNSTIYGDVIDGGEITLYDGIAHWRGYQLSSEIGYALSGCTTGSMYDLYIYWNGTALQFDTPVQWSSPTTMPSRTVINGVSLNPANTTRRLVCSFYCIGTNLTIDHPIARCLSNQQNRKERVVYCENTTIYSYGGGFRVARGATNVLSNVGIEYFWCASSDGTNIAHLTETGIVEVSSGNTADLGLGFSGASSFPSAFAINGNNETVSLTSPFTAQLTPGFNSINDYETTNGTSIFNNLFVSGTVEN
jgi:hypothetical protein